MKPRVILWVWMIVLIFVSFTSLLLYIVVQQSLRLGANTEPAAMGQDAVIQLEAGQSPESVVGNASTELSQSFRPFLLIFDSQKRLVASSVKLEPSDTYPAGNLTYVDQHGEDRVTWQPVKGLRYATVAVKYNGGYVVAGQSLKETQRLILLEGRLILWAWVVSVAIVSVIALIIRNYLKKNLKESDDPQKSLKESDDPPEAKE